MRLLGLTIALLTITASITRAAPWEEPNYSLVSCTLNRIEPADGSSHDFLKLDQKMLTAPVAVGNWLYVGDSGGVVHALATRDGAKQWEFTAARGIDCIAATDKTVFIGAGKLVYAIDAMTGKQAWAKSADQSVKSLTLVDGLVVFNMEHGPIGLEQSNGDMRWQLDMTWMRGFVLSPLPERRLCLWKADEIFVIATDTGKTLWHKTPEQTSTAYGALPSPAVADGDFICQLRGSPTNAQDWSLVGLETASGRRVWSTPVGEHPNAGARCAIFDKTAYAIFDSRIYAINSVGDIAWQAEIKPLEAGGPTVLEAHGRLYIPELGGGVTALHAKSGDTLWQNPAPKPGRKGSVFVGGIAANQAALFVTRNEELRE